LDQGLKILRNLSNERRRGNETKDDAEETENEDEYQHEELKYWTSS